MAGELLQQLERAPKGNPTGANQYQGGNVPAWNNSSEYKEVLADSDIAPTTAHRWRWAGAVGLSVPFLGSSLLTCGKIVVWLRHISTWAKCAAEVAHFAHINPHFVIMKHTEIDPDIDNEDELTAYHEAAHFVMGRIARGGLPRRISIVPDPEGSYLGTCGGSPSYPDAETLFAMAGIVFEEYHAGAGGFDDLSVVTANLDFLYGDQADTQYGAYFSFTAKLMSYAAFRKAWRLTAERLLLLKELDQEQIYDLVDDAEKAMGKWLAKLRYRVGDFLYTAPELSPQQILAWHVQRDKRFG